MDYFEHLDFYEVDKEDFRSYRYRLKDRKLYTQSLEPGITVYYDEELQVPVLGEREENVMGMPAKQFYIFEFLDEELLGEPMAIKYVTLSAVEWQNFISKLPINKEKN